MKPFLSVVITVRNRGAYLREAVESVLASQNPPRFEIVIVDDCSDDDTLDVIASLRQQDRRIRVRYNSCRRGPGGARNRGNAMAQGKVIVVQDSDDVSLPGRLAAVGHAFKADPELDLWYSGGWRGDSKLIRVGIHHADLGQVGLLPQRQFIWHPTLAYRRAVVSTGVRGQGPLKYPEEAADVDYGFLLQAWKRGLKFGCLDQPLVVYRGHPGQISREQGRLQQELASQKRHQLKGGPR